jgi:hypothetical protein
MPNLTLTLLKDAYAVCRLAPDAPVPAPSTGAFSHLVRAPDETTLVCPASEVPAEAEVDRDWRCFRIEQSFDFGTPGILASVLGPLAEAGIGIFATSTFSTDYILVKAKDVVMAIKALARAGHRVETAQG